MKQEIHLTTASCSRQQSTEYKRYKLTTSYCGTVRIYLKKVSRAAHLEIITFGPPGISALQMKKPKPSDTLFAGSDVRE